MATTNKYLLCAVFALAFAGCAADGDIATGDGAGKDGKGKAYVTLSLSMDNVAPATRANPTGGETGDGYERGQSYENVVSSAVAFFFRGNGVNTSAGTPIDGVAEFSQFSTPVDGNNNPVDKKYTTQPQQVDLENGKYSVIVVANPGDQKWWNAGTLTLGDVRDHIYKKAWKDANGTFSDFLMTSATDATLTLTPDATQQDPAEVEATVERVAARIDYNADEQGYECTDPAYTGATVQITGAAIVNNLTAGSYLLKRVADDATGTNIIYLGDETADANRVPTNYVIDPWTVAKIEDNDSFTIDGTSDQQASALYGVWFGNQNQTVLDPSGVSELLTPGYWDKLCTMGTPLVTVTGGTTGYNRIGYTLENTTAADCAGPRYTTGVVFKAKFNPANVPNYAGGTFFSRGSTLYAYMEDMMEAVYGESQFAQFNNMINEKCTWGSILAWANTLYSEDPSGYVDFLKAECAKHDQAAQVTDAEKNSLYWSAYMLNECGYSAVNTDGTWVVKLNQNGKNTRTALRPHGVRTYEDGQCYYTWWVRHGNDNKDETNGVMEYGIVRNNVYKLDVQSVYSIGGDIPGEEGLNVEVYVKDWTLLETETLPM